MVILKSRVTSPNKKARDISYVPQTAIFLSDIDPRNSGKSGTYQKLELKKTPFLNSNNPIDAEENNRLMTDRILEPWRRHQS